MNRTFSGTSNYGAPATSADGTLLEQIQDDGSVEAIIRQSLNPTETKGAAGWGRMSRHEEQLRRLVGRASVSYLVEGIIRQAVDKYTELCGGFFLDGDDKAVQYLTRRLETMSLQAGEHWRTTLGRILHEYFKTGNPVFTKVRGTVTGARRPFYRNRPYAICAFFPVAADRLQPAHDEKGAPIGWRFVDGTQGATDLITPGAKALDADGAMMRALPLPEARKADTLQRGVDVVHIAYKKPADSSYGVGVVFSALDDVGLQRSLEQITANAARKNAHPVTHVLLSRPSSHLANIETDIANMGRMWKRAAPDGVVITGPNVEMKTFGAESHAMRMGEYLTHFTKRAFCSLGVSPYLMGFEGATLGTAEAAQAVLLDRVRTAQAEFAQEFEMFFLWEILWEGGFDPFANEKHRVYLKFEEKDKGRQIRHETHGADLFVKGGIDREEYRRDYLGRRRPMDESKSYLNLYQIPLEKAKSEASVEVASIGAKAQVAAVKARPVPKAAKSDAEIEITPEILKEATRLLPEAFETVEDVPLLAERFFGIPREAFSAETSALGALLESEDREAAAYLVAGVIAPFLTPPTL